MKKLVFLIIAAALLTGSTCSGPSKYELADREGDLPARVKEYHDWYGWRDFDAASELVARGARPGFMGYAETLKRGYMVEGYAVSNITMNATGDRAAVKVQRSYIKAPSVTLETEEIVQEWVWVDGGWYLSGPPY